MCDEELGICGLGGQRQRPCTKFFGKYLYYYVSNSIVIYFNFQTTCANWACLQQSQTRPKYVAHNFVCSLVLGEEGKKKKSDQIKAKSNILKWCNFVWHSRLTQRHEFFVSSPCSVFFPCLASESSVPLFSLYIYMPLAGKRCSWHWASQPQCHHATQCFTEKHQDTRKL